MVGESAGVGKLVERWSDVMEAVVKNKMVAAVETVCVPMGAVGV